VCCSDHCSGIPNQLLKVPEIKKYSVEFLEDVCGSYMGMLHLVKQTIVRHTDALEELSLTLPFENFGELDILEMEFPKMKSFSVTLSVSSMAHRLDIPNFTNLKSLSLTSLPSFTFLVESIPIELFSKLESLKMKSIALFDQHRRDIFNSLNSCQDLSLGNMFLDEPVNFQSFMDLDFISRLTKLSLKLEDDWCDNVDDPALTLRLPLLEELKLSGSMVDADLVSKFCCASPLLSDLKFTAREDTRELFQHEKEVLNWCLSNFLALKNLRSVSMKFVLPEDTVGVSRAMFGHTNQFIKQVTKELKSLERLIFSAKVDGKGVISTKSYTPHIYLERSCKARMHYKERLAEIHQAFMRFQVKPQSSKKRKLQHIS
jgi:hypothetical protein